MTNVHLWSVWGLMALTCLGGCSSDGEDASPAPQPATDAAVDANDGHDADDAAMEASTEAAADDAADAADLSALLIGTWKEPLPSPAVMRFDADGTCRVAVSADKLDSDPFGVADWDLDDHRLTFTQTAGVCSAVEEEKVGTYDIVVDATTLTFSIESDVCAQRNVIAGETWTRLD